MSDRRRAKNLDPRAVESILLLLDGWTNALTWQYLIEAVRERLGERYTRQALAGHERIAHAFAQRKQDLRVLRKGVPRELSAEQRLEADRINRLEATVSRLERENQLLRERFVLWAYNAHVHGVGERELNKALPPVDRGPTVLGDRPQRVR